MTLRLPVLVAALWWGSLTTIGFLVVPLLFAHLPSPALAGGMAARLFAAQTWVSVACCMVLLMISRPKGSVTPYPWAQAAIVFIVGGLLLALVSKHKMDLHNIPILELIDQYTRTVEQADPDPEHDESRQQAGRVVRVRGGRRQEPGRTGDGGAGSLAMARAELAAAA